MQVAVKHTFLLISPFVNQKMTEYLNRHNLGENQNISPKKFRIIAGYPQYTSANFGIKISYGYREIAFCLVGCFLSHTVDVFSFIVSEVIQCMVQLLSFNVKTIESF